MCRHTLASLVILIETVRNIFIAILFRMNLNSGANNTGFRSSGAIHRENISFRFPRFPSYKVLSARRGAVFRAAMTARNLDHYYRGNED